MFSSSVDGKVVDKSGMKWLFRNQMWDNKEMITPFSAKGSEIQNETLKFLPGYPNCGPCTEVRNL